MLKKVCAGGMNVGGGEAQNTSVTFLFFSIALPFESA